VHIFFNFFFWHKLKELQGTLCPLVSKNNEK
jgi:hypothetical protein